MKSNVGWAALHGPLLLLVILLSATVTSGQEAQLLGDVLVSPFKFDDTLLISTLRFREDVLEEEIFTAEDLPARTGVQTMRARGLQRLTLRRVVVDPSRQGER